MTNQELLDAGYKRWAPSPYREFETDMFEKCVRDEKGKKYFIHISRWDFTQLDNQVNVRYDSTVQFTHKNGEVVNVDGLNGWDLQELEKFYEDLWNTGWFKYYEVDDYENDEES